MYTAVYAPNRLTIIDTYDDTTFARDLLAQAIVEGRLDKGSEEYSLTSISEALAIGKKLSVGSSTSEFYYIQGTITSIDNTTYGNLYIKDEAGNIMYIYGLYDQYGNKYNAMTNKPVVGDTITVVSVIYRYSNSTIELKSAVLVEIS